MQEEFEDKLNKLTHGEVDIKILEKKWSKHFKSYINLD
jgi:hypothetical protein